MWMLKYIILLRPISSIFEHTYLSTNYEIITWRNFYQWKLVILLYLNVKQEVNEWKRVHLRSIRHSCLARHIKSTIAEQKKIQNNNKKARYDTWSQTKIIFWKTEPDKPLLMCCVRNTDITTKKEKGTHRQSRDAYNNVLVSV